MRELFTSFLLFTGVNKDHVKTLYKNILNIERQDFHYEEFEKIYLK